MNYSPDHRGRGWLTLTVEAGRIKYFRMRYDLNDPETIRIRTLVGEMVFAMMAPDLVASPGRILLKQGATEAQTVVVVYMGEPETAQPTFSARLTRNDGTVERVAAVLSDVEDGQSESTIPIAMDVLLSGRYRAEVRRPGDSAIVVACTLKGLRDPLRVIRLRERLTEPGPWPAVISGARRVDQAVTALEAAARSALERRDSSHALYQVFKWMRAIHGELDEGTVDEPARIVALAALARWIGIFPMLPTAIDEDPAIVTWTAEERARIETHLRAVGASSEVGPADTRWTPL
jgi:hypothetical protein